MLSQLSPIMEQLAGVNLKSFLQGISKLPGAVSESMTRTATAEPPAGPPPAPRP